MNQLHYYECFVVDSHCLSGSLISATRLDCPPGDYPTNHCFTVHTPIGSGGLFDHGIAMVWLVQARVWSMEINDEMA